MCIRDRHNYNKEHHIQNIENLGSEAFILNHRYHLLKQFITGKFICKPVTQGNQYDLSLIHILLGQGNIIIGTYFN